MAGWKRIVARGAGYARRRSRTRYVAPKTTPEQDAHIREQIEKLPESIFGCLMVVFLFLFACLGLMWAWQKVTYFLGL
jgi:hypothetical protein